MYLVPGDSPMGMRLPMDSLPWAPAEEREQFYELDPTAPRGPLAPQAVFPQASLDGSHEAASRTKEPGAIPQSGFGLG